MLYSAGIRKATPSGSVVSKDHVVSLGSAGNQGGIDALIKRRQRPLVLNRQHKEVELGLFHQDRVRALSSHDEPTGTDFHRRLEHIQKTRTFPPLRHRVANCCVS